MSKENELAIRNDFKQIGGEYKNARSEFLKVEKIAQELIDNETKKEKEELDKAFRKYNDKMAKITKSEKFQKLEKDAINYSNEMSKNLLKAKNSFLNVKDEIMKREDWDDKKKQSKVDELFNYVLGKLYSKDEVEQFKKLMNSIVII